MVLCVASIHLPEMSTRQPSNQEGGGRNEKEKVRSPKWGCVNYGLFFFVFSVIKINFWWVTKWSLFLDILIVPLISPNPLGLLARNLPESSKILQCTFGNMPVSSICTMHFHWSFIFSTYGLYFSEPTISTTPKRLLHGATANLYSYRKPYSYHKPYSCRKPILLPQTYTPIANLYSSRKPILLPQTYTPTANLTPTTNLYSYYKPILLPQTYTPTANLHSYRKPTLLPQTYTPTANLHSYRKPTLLPQTYTPTANLHSYRKPTLLPQTYTPTANLHSYRKPTLLPQTYTPTANLQSFKSYPAFLWTCSNVSVFLAFDINYVRPKITWAGLISQNFWQISFCPNSSWKKRSSHQGKKEIACIVSKPVVSCLWGCGESVNPPKLNIQELQGGLCPLDQMETQARYPVSGFFTFVKSHPCFN